jgi:hypothetical protein
MRWGAWIVCALSAATAAPSFAERASLAEIDALIELAGLRYELEVVGENLAAGFEADTDLDAVPRARLAAAARRAFCASALVGDLGDELLLRSDAGAVRAANAWLRSELGQRVRAAEVAVTAGDAAERAARHARSLQRRPPRAARLARVQRLDAASRRTETAVDAALALATASLLARNAARGFPHPETELRRAVAVHGRAEYERTMRPAATAVALQTFEAFSEGELAAVITHFDSPAGRWRVDATHAALLASYAKATQRLLAELGFAAGSAAAPSAARCIRP